MDQILDQCEGVIGIADDVVVHGKDDEEHDWWLHKLRKVAQEHGLIFSGEKCAVKHNSVKCLWQGQCSPWSCYGQCHEGDACSIITNRTPKLPRNGNLPSTIYTLTLDTHSSTMGTTHKKYGIHLECNLLRSIWQIQVLGMQWHHTPILQCEETSDHTGWCFQKRTWSCYSIGWWASFLCPQNIYPNRTVLC